MKIIGSVKEDLAVEKRISITPETVKKLIDLKFSVFLEKNYGDHLGISDEEFKNKGANLYGSAKEVLEKSEIILKVNCPSSEQINAIKNKSILIGQFNPFSNKEIINKLIKKDNKIFYAGNVLLFHVLRQSTIGAEGLDFRVRNGSGYGPFAIITGM